jgi:hypothetical protein
MKINKLPRFLDDLLKGKEIDVEDDQTHAKDSAPNVSGAQMFMACPEHRA